MKRLLLAVFAAAVTAAWAVPSTAADFTFSGQYRLRGEYSNNTDFNDADAAGTTNDHMDSWGQRVRLTANAKVTDDTSVKITLQDTRTWGTTNEVPVTNGTATAANGGPALTDTNNSIDLHESYLQLNKVFGAPVDLRIGRQELAYGDERLIGSFGWNNNGRSFDAIKAMYTSEAFNLDVFTSKIDENTTTGRDQDLWGAYATVKSIPNNTLDIYVLRLSDHSTTAPMVTNNNDTTDYAGLVLGSQTLWTYGVRIKGATSGIDYTAELPFQKGTIKSDAGDIDLKARALAVKAGYTIPNTPKVRVGAEYDMASGDDDETDMKNETFSNLFPTNHDKLGYMDQQGWRNVKAWSLNVSAEPSDKLRLQAHYWNFKLDKKADSWYAAGNWMNSVTVASLRDGSATENNDDIGNEIDLVATYKYNSAVTAELGVSRFSPGSFIKDRITAAGGEEASQDWAYLQLIANF